MYKRKTASGVLLASMLILVSACVGKVQPTQAEDPVQAASDAKNSMDYLAAINLINTLVQVPRLHPESAREVLMVPPESDFGRHISEVMALAGYGISYVDSDNGEPLFLSYKQRTDADESTYQIDVEGFKARRTYSVVGRQVKPQSSMYIFGADPASIEPNDRIFAQYRAIPVPI